MSSGKTRRRRDRGVIPLESVARRLRPEEVATEKATERINFLVTPAEKAAIRAAAEGFGLTVTEYFLRLHRLTAAMVTARRRKATGAGTS